MTENKVVALTLDHEVLTFETHPALFSPRYVDKGTLAMLKEAAFQKDDLVLDLGCGYGVVGIYAARKTDPSNVHMTDKDPLAVEIARKNASRNKAEGIRVLESDLYEALGNMKFTKILCNPPYHTDFSVAKRIIEGAIRHLHPGGALYLVTKRKEWYKRKCISVFGGVRITEASGYFVFMSMKTSQRR